MKIYLAVIVILLISCNERSLSEDLPTDRYCVEIDIPNDVEILELSIDDLPKN